MTIERFVTSRTLALSLRSAVALTALACVGAAQAQIPNQQRLLPTTAASAATSAVTAAATTNSTVSAPSTSSVASNEGTTQTTSHVSHRKHVTHHRAYAAHKVSHSYAQTQAPTPTAPQTHYEGTTVTGAAEPAAVPAVDTYQAPPVPVVDEHNFPPSEIGHSTNAWMSLQASNRDAMHEEPMLGAAATAAYQRYIDSFKHPIPDAYGSKLGGTGSGGGSQ